MAPSPLTNCRKKILILPLIILIVVVGLYILLLIQRDVSKRQGYVSLKQSQAVKKPINAASSTIAPQQTPTSSAQTLQTATSSLKTYRNEKFGFEFQYPEGWSFFPNIFYSPFSKFNLVGASPDENFIPDAISPSFLANIVTPEFVNRQFSDLQNIGLHMIIGGVAGIKYEYQDEGISEISVILPIGNNEIILGTNKKHEEALNEIISTFKFVK